MVPEYLSWFSAAFSNFSYFRKPSHPWWVHKAACRDCSLFVTNRVRHRSVYVFWMERLMDKVYRFIEYRRALWFADGGTVEENLRTALQARVTTDQRIVYRSDGSSVMANQSFDFEAGGIGLQCARYVDGQPVSIVPMTGEETAALGEQPPGNSENYLNDAFFALISGD